MICPKCNSSNLRVVEKRDIENDPAIRRRRECCDCQFRFTTYERLEVPVLTIVKKNGHRELFSREKLASGIYRALQKRPVENSVKDSLVSSIEKELHATGDTEIASDFIGELVMRKLLCVDEVAYLRFASVYKSFDSLETFKDELAKVTKEKKKVC